MPSGRARVGDVQGARERAARARARQARLRQRAARVRCRCARRHGAADHMPRRFDMDPAWSETGDRYMLKLFRDYVFHQVDDNGEPVVNLAHVVTCLNKFDAGSPEKIMLTSRDEQSCLIVSYYDLKVCAENAFAELQRRAPSMAHSSG
eukprot:Unigene10713_Nuclearia_a/m.32759 Unigene10713_Nuclearia_a/g.32759  ORF Unigene10713_Nuclearia_a/g.32759 Unigene10713_Nuclearia_a/m.32759 type:complete len:149 (+) Unigene10713_Nuclearia_a:111-557(+)